MVGGGSFGASKNNPNSNSQTKTTNSRQDKLAKEILLEMKSRYDAPFTDEQAKEAAENIQSSIGNLLGWSKNMHVQK